MSQSGRARNIVYLDDYKEKKRLERLKMWVEVLAESPCHRCGHEITVIHNEEGEIMCKCTNCGWMAFY